MGLAVKMGGYRLLVSIIVPVYKVEEYLPQCLDSLIGQTYENLEIICVNDGSPDGCAEILQAYVRKDGRVKIITQENRGLSAARNAGIQYAAGEYVMFVDGDDWIDVDTCSVAVQAVREHGADLVFWHYIREYQNQSKERIFFWEHGEVFEQARIRDQLHRRQCGLLGEELRHPEMGDSLVTAWGKLYALKKLRESGAFFVDTKQIGTEDALFNLTALGNFEKAVYVKRAMYHYRKTNAGSLTKSYKSQLPKQWKTLFDRMKEYIEDNELSVDYVQALDNRISLSVVGLGLNAMEARCGEMRKISMIKDILSHRQYRQSIQSLELRYLPLHWKAFFLCAKWRCSVGVYMMLRAIKRIIG